MRSNPFDRTERPTEISLSDEHLEALVDPASNPEDHLIEIEEEALDYLTGHGESVNVYTLRWAVNLIYKRS